MVVLPSPCRPKCGRASHPSWARVPTMGEKRVRISRCSPPSDMLATPNLASQLSHSDSGAPCATESVLNAQL
jgi:hypothetical protein